MRLFTLLTFLYLATAYSSLDKDNEPKQTFTYYIGTGS